MAFSFLTVFCFASAQERTFVGYLYQNQKGEVFLVSERISKAIFYERHKVVAGYELPSLQDKAPLLKKVPQIRYYDAKSLLGAL